MSLLRSAVAVRCWWPLALAASACGGRAERPVAPAEPATVAEALVPGLPVSADALVATGDWTSSYRLDVSGRPGAVRFAYAVTRSSVTAAPAVSAFADGGALDPSDGAFVNLSAELLPASVEGSAVRVWLRRLDAAGALVGTVTSVSSAAKCDKSTPATTAAKVEVVRATGATQPATGWAQLKFSGFADAKSGIDRYDVYVRSGAVAPEGCAETAAPLVTRVAFAPADSGKRGLSGLAEGSVFSVAVCAVDKAGNVSAAVKLADVREASQAQLKGPVAKDAGGRVSALVLSQHGLAGYARDLAEPIDAALLPAPAAPVRDTLQVCFSELDKLATAGNDCADEGAAGWLDLFDAAAGTFHPLAFSFAAPRVSGRTSTVYAYLRDRSIRAPAASPLKASILFDALPPTGTAATVAARRGDRSAVFTLAKLADPVDPGQGSKASGPGGVRVAASSTAAPADCTTPLAGCSTATSATGATVTCGGDASGLVNGTSYNFTLCTFDKAGNAGPVLTASSFPALWLMPAPTDKAPSGGVAAANGAAAKPALALSGTPSVDATNQSTVAVRLAATGASYGAPAAPKTAKVEDYCVTTSTACPDGRWKRYASPDEKQADVVVSGVDLGPSEGAKTVSVWFRDEYRNVSSASTLKVKLDRTAPKDGTVALRARVGTAMGGPGDGAAALSWAAGTDAFSGLAGYRVRAGIGAAPASCAAGAAACETGTGTKACTVTGLANGVKVGFRVCAIDRAGNLSTGMTVEATPAGSGPDGAIEAALASGDPSSLADATGLIKAALDEIASENTVDRAMLQAFHPYGFPGASYRPGKNSQLVVPDGSNESIVPILVGDGRQPLAVAGRVGPGRFLAYGALPMRQSAYADGLFKRALAWLATGSADTQASPGFKVATVHAPDGAFTRSWLQTNLSWTTTDCTATGATPEAKANALEACLSSQQLLVVGKGASDAVAPVLVDAVAKALAAGVPVLYQHPDWGSSRASEGLAALLGFSQPYGGNWWADDGVGLDDPAVLVDHVASFRGHSSLAVTLDHFRAKDWQLDLSACGNASCPAGHPIHAAFFDGVRSLRSTLTGLDEHGVALFAQDGLRLPKLLALLGDVFRRDIDYPLDRKKTPNDAFLRALFADHAVVHVGSVNPAQPDLGNFSKPIPPTTPVFDRDVTVTPRPQDHFTAAGVYAHPGRPFTVRRTDSAPVTVKVAINSLRSASTKPFDPDAYTRPQFLMSPWLPLAPGQSLTVTSPYGGPVQVWVQGSESSPDVALSFTGVGQHPVWSGPETTAAFKAALDEDVYQWAEFLTPGFQIHARRALMLQTLSDPLTPTPEALAAVTWDHFYRAIFDLGGWTGPGLSLSVRVSAFCDGRGWDCTSPSLHGMRGMWHFNSDQATCGYGCSGNPYDAWWAFSPLGWGDAHEVGHGLQRARFDVHGTSGESSNNIYPTYTVYSWNKAHPDAIVHGGHEKTQAAIVKLLSAAQGEADPAKTLSDRVWHGDDGIFTIGGQSVPVSGVVFLRLEFFRQVALQADGLAAFGHGAGWDVWTVLHLQERLFDMAVQDDVKWLAQRASLGFDGVERTVARGFGANDYLLVALSSVTGLDERPFFDLWGVTYGNDASARVEAMGLPAAEKRFFLVEEDLHGLAYAGSDPVDSVLIAP